MPRDVFVSYCNADKMVADAICAAFEAANISCWIAPRDVAPGSFYAESLVAGIRECRILILVFSSHANSSPHVIREVERAVHNDTPVVPFRVDNAQPSGSMEYLISSTQWLDANTPPLDIHLLHLLGVVRTLLSVKPTPNSEGLQVDPDRKSHPQHIPPMEQIEHSLQQKDYKGAKESLRRREQICVQQNLRRELAETFAKQATLEWLCGDLDASLVSDKAGEAIWRELGEQRAIAVSIGNQGGIMELHGNSDGALALYRDEESIYRGLGSREDIAYCLGKQASLLRDRGDLDNATLLREQSERICREVDHMPGLAQSLILKGLIRLDRGDLNEALAFEKEAERLCRDLDMKSQLSVCLAYQALIQRENGNHGESDELLKNATAMASLNGGSVLIGKIAAIKAQIDKLPPNVIGQEQVPELTLEDQLIEEVTSRFGLPRQYIRLHAHLVYCLYEDVLVKIIWSDQPNVISFTPVPRNADGIAGQMSLPCHNGWDSPQGFSRQAILRGSLVQGMRLEDVVLVAGVPQRLSEHSGIGPYWNWNHPRFGLLQFDSSGESLILRTPMKDLK